LRCARAQPDDLLSIDIERVLAGEPRVNRQFKAQRPNQLCVSDFT
jgi:hypothetical protein